MSETEIVMVYLDGSKRSFRCDARAPSATTKSEKCGANVFRKTAPTRYECNACGAKYIGEPDAARTPEEKDRNE